MIKKTLYSAPDFKVRELKGRCVICASQGQGSNEGLTEDETGNDYDE